MTTLQAQQTFSKHVALLILHMQNIGYEVTFGEALRTKEQQEIYLKTGKTKTRNSRHLVRLAVDLLLFRDGKYLTDNADYKEAAEFWKSLDPSNVAGYDWGWDGQHFERTPPTTPPKKS